MIHRSEVIRMTNFWYRYGFPFVIMIVSGLLVRLERTFLSGNIESTAVTITAAVCMFAFGIAVNRHKRKRNESWLKKIFISFFLIFFLFWDLGFFLIPSLKNFFDLIGISGFVIHLFYVYLGYCFFD